MSNYALASLVEEIIADIRDGLVPTPTFERRTNAKEIWYELAFCITSSQERTRRAQSAARALAGSYEALCTSRDVAETIRTSIQNAYVSLRFINRKTEQLVESWGVFQSDLATLQAIDENFQTPAQARDYLISNYAGIGPKQASMLLRNLGFGSDLAIIDSHIARMSLVILDDAPPASRYSVLEGRLREFADNRQVSLQTLDVVLWSCSRLARSWEPEERLLV